MNKINDIKNEFNLVQEALFEYKDKVLKNSKKINKIKIELDNLLEESRNNENELGLLFLKLCDKQDQILNN